MTHSRTSEKNTALHSRIAAPIGDRIVPISDAKLEPGGDCRLVWRLFDLLPEGGRLASAIRLGVDQALPRVVENPREDCPMTHAFTVSSVIPASPMEIYDAWLNGKRHAQMTGSETATASTKVGGKFTAWDGYINGRNVSLVPGKKIVQAWRTSEFADSDEDSQIEVTLEKSARGTRVTLRHSNVPDSHQGYRSGWGDHYFEPMKAYFGKMADRSAGKSTKIASSEKKGRRGK